MLLLLDELMSYFAASTNGCLDLRRRAFYNVLILTSLRSQNKGVLDLTFWVYRESVKVKVKDSFFLSAKG